MASGRRRGTWGLLAVLAWSSLPLHAQQRQVGGELALASQLVDRGLAITPATPVLQGAVSWMSPGGWSFGLAGGVALRSPDRPVLLLARASRSWALSADWLAQGSLVYYDYRSAIPDRVDASVSITYRDMLTVGFSALRADGQAGQRLLGAADLAVSYPLARRVSLSAGAGVAQVAAGHYGPGSAPYPAYGYHPVRRYGYGSLGLAWGDGPLRLRVDRHMNSLGERQVYGTRASADWVATLSWAF